MSNDFLSVTNLIIFLLTPAQNLAPANALTPAHALIAADALIVADAPAVVRDLTLRAITHHVNLTISYIVKNHLIK